MKTLTKKIAAAITVSGLFFIPVLSSAQDIKESEDNMDPDYKRLTMTYITNQNNEETVIGELNSHIRLSTLTSDIEIKNVLIDTGYNSAQQITSRPYNEEED